MMAEEKKELISIALLLKQPKTIDQAAVQRAAEAAFRGAPEKPRTVPLPSGRGFGVALGPLRLGLLSVAQPYFKDVAKVADRVRDFAGRKAVQEHTAWLSVDLVGDPPPIDRSKVYGMIGCLIAEFLGDDVLGLMRLPAGPVIGYDFSFIPTFRNRRASEVFEKGSPDRLVKISANDEALLAATAEAKQRWPEFLSAFANRSPGQAFAVKKKFVDGKQIEHMWVEVKKIDGSTLHGLLSNIPQIIKSLKAHDPVTLSTDEVDDWIYTNGKTNEGGFQAKALKGKQ
jgi:uncharacterized protein YegJ (DUF2314 family)